jgi:hypothetical protein
MSINFFLYYYIYNSTILYYFNLYYKEKIDIIDIKLIIR